MVHRICYAPDRDIGCFQRDTLLNSKKPAQSIWDYAGFIHTARSVAII